MKKLILYTLIILLLFFVFNYLTTFKTKNKSVLNYHRYEELVFLLMKKITKISLTNLKLIIPFLANFFQIRF